jgi:hypothetical protein
MIERMPLRTIRTRVDLLAAVVIHAPLRQPTYVRTGDIPQPWRSEFLTAIQGRPLLAIPGQTDVAYAFDWKDWVRGKTEWLPKPSGGFP